MNNRIVWVDIAKGIGILLVVYAHIFSFGKSCIYLFHMPLFFFLSGIFFTPDIKMGDILKNKFYTLILPYFFFAAIFIPFKYWILYISNQPLPPFGVHCLNRGFFDVPLWFLFVLFGINIFYRVCHMIRSWYLLWMVIIVASIMGWYCAAFHLQLPIFFIKVLLALPFFALGHAYNRLSCLQEGKLYRAISSVGFVVIASLLGVKTDMSLCEVDKNVILYMFSALGGGNIVVYLSQVLAKSEKKINIIFSYLGKNSLYVFACHWPFIMPLAMFFDKYALPYTLSRILIMFLSILFSLIIGYYLKPVLINIILKIKDVKI